MLPAAANAAFLRVAVAQQLRMWAADILYRQPRTTYRRLSSTESVAGAADLLDAVVWMIAGVSRAGMSARVESRQEVDARR